MTPEKALDELRQGNQRFVAGAAFPKTIQPELLATLTKGQSPFATIISCSDARVPVELIFDQGFDDLFTIRVAGNVVGHNCLGSVHYAALHVHTPLIVVLGHSFCGAVTAALAPSRERSQEPESIQYVLQQIDPALADIDASLPLEQRVALGVKKNVNRVVTGLAKDRVLEPLLNEKKLAVVGAIYDLKTGAVEFLQDIKF